MVSYELCGDGRVQSILFYVKKAIQKFVSGSEKSCKHSYGVCLGRADTLGQSSDPFSALLEREIGMPILNLEARHSGAGFNIEDDAIHEIIENAQVIFVEARSVVNQSNPFYRVHPRRNDRFVTALGPYTIYFPRRTLLSAILPNI